MCYFYDQSVKDKVAEIISQLVRKRKRFTGWEVFKMLETEKGFAHLPPSWQVGSYVRELFNGKSAAFDGYASYPINCEGGPLLYFPIPYYVKNHVEKIKKEIEEKGT